MREKCNVRARIEQHAVVSVGRMSEGDGANGKSEVDDERSFRRCCQRVDEGPQSGRIVLDLG